MKNKLLLTPLLALMAIAGAHAQLIPTGNVYESSQFGGNFGAQNLFDGTGLSTTLGVAGDTSLGNSYASNAVNGYIGDGGGNGAPVDPNPIVAFNLGSSYTVTSVDYAQRGTNAGDEVLTGNVFALTAAQYTAYTAGLLVSNDSAPATEGSAVAAPTSFTGEATFTTTGDTDTYTNFTLSAPLTGQYYVTQFFGILASESAVGGHPGGDEFELVGTVATPEPSTYALMALGLGAVCFFARRKLA